MKNNEIANKPSWLYLAGFYIILALPILIWPPWFFPADWGKSIIFRSIMAILLFACLWRFLIGKNSFDWQKLKQNKIIWALAALFGVYLLSTIFSVDPSFSLWSSPYRGGGFVTFAFCFVFAIMAVMFFRKEDWKKAWLFSIFIGVLVSFVAVIQYDPTLNYIFSAVLNALYHKSILLVPSRPPSTMGNPDILAVYLLLLSFVTLSFGIKWQKIWEKVFCFLSLVIFVFTLLITGSRAGYLGLLIGAIYFFIAYPKKMRVLKSAGIALVVLAIGAVLYANTTNHFPKSLQQNKIFNSVVSRLSLNNVTNDARFAAWEISWSALKIRPLLGYGPENFAVGFDKFYDSTIPNINQGSSWYDKAHNIILQTGSDAGVLGILAYLALFVALFWQLQKIKTAEARAIQATLISYFTTIFFGFDSFSTYLIFFLLIAYSLHLTSANASNYVIGKKIFGSKIITSILFLVLIIFLWQYNFVPLQINAQINIAESLANQKQCDQAFAVMDKILPEHSILDSYTRLEYVEFERTCSVFYPQNNLAYTQKGAQLISQAVKIQPLYTRYWLFLGNLTTTLAEQQTSATEENSMLVQADGYLDKALQLAPKHQEIFTAKAKVQIDEGNYENAKKELEKCIALNPNFGDCYFDLGIAEIYLKDNDNANKNIQLAKSKYFDINSLASLVALGDAYGSANVLDYQNLATVFEKLIALDPNNVQDHSTLAFCYAKLGRYADARKQAEIVLQLSPQSKDNVNAFLQTLP